MLVIFYVIYVNLCNCELFPNTWDNYIYVYIENCIFISVIVFYFCIFSSFYWGRAKFNNFFHFWLYIC